jgi:uncharacterized DUF497 family protein
VIFRWDAQKAANLKKHGIDFHEAATVLNDTLSTTFPDEAHSRFEARFLRSACPAAAASWWWSIASTTT